VCAQFETTDRDYVIERWGINPKSNVIGAANWGTIYPKYETLLIICNNEPIVRSWGLTPEWARRPVINAKCEEAHQKKTFIPLLTNRCVIPAASYYEWQGKKGSKVKTNIFGNSMFAIAGLYTKHQYVMFTCASAKAIAGIHHRMPAILEEESVNDWLNPENNYADIKSLLKTFGGLLEWQQGTS
jgi:putative SOS response-associated peptidase YedK